MSEQVGLRVLSATSEDFTLDGVRCGETSLSVSTMSENRSRRSRRAWRSGTSLLDAPNGAEIQDHVGNPINAQRLYDGLSRGVYP